MPGPRGACPVGWKSQGKKLAPTPLRRRRSRRSRSSARSGHHEARCVHGPISTHGRRCGKPVSCTRWRRRWARRKAAEQTKAVPSATETSARDAPRHRLQWCRLITGQPHLRVQKSCEIRTDAQISDPTASSPVQDRRSGDARQILRGAAVRTGSRRSGAASSVPGRWCSDSTVMRAKAVQPTATAPTKAKQSRQNNDAMPNCDRASTA